MPLMEISRMQPFLDWLPLRLYKEMKLLAQVST